MTSKAYERTAHILKMLGLILALGAFIMFSCKIVPENQARRDDDAKHHQELIDAIEQMMFICEP